ncbi:transporter substrate-binding domain-containing protein [Actinomadura sp. 1N219]|uniref:transporter substrate-binding domain-containing protein n=1 Tax=Actinomadura sp. 1N219 TaxID=3375152 RepID=UPI0037BC9AFD
MRTRRLGAAVIFTSAILTAAACGGASETSDAGVKPAETAPGQRTAGKVKAPPKFAQPGTITFCSTFTNPPRSFTQDGKQVGSEVELGQALAATLGLKPKWVQVRVDGLVASLLGGHCDMIVSQLKIVPERDKTAWQLPYSIAATQLVVGAGNPKKISDFSSLAGKKIAAPDGSVAHGLLEDMNKQLAGSGGKQINIVPLAGTSELFQQVAAGTVDAAATTYSAGSYYLRKAPGRLELAGQPCLSDVKAGGKMGFMIAKNNRDLYTAMEQAMTAVRGSGEYRDIFHRYGLDKETLDAAETSKPVACLPAGKTP